jgi:hypothetical protein
MASILGTVWESWPVSSKVMTARERVVRVTPARKEEADIRAKIPGLVCVMGKSWAVRRPKRAPASIGG